jgi:DNA-binding SARP family transcriptional activator
MNYGKQTILSKREIPLLTYAISKLSPSVFSHPVWIRFGRNHKIFPPQTIQDLFGEAEQLQRDHPGDACQVLLICAVYQSCSGQRASALATLQKALDLAERARLAQESLWAIWGAGAICVQAGDYERAAIHFGHLQAVLHEQNEWMLADYIDVVRQSFLLSSATDPDEYSASTEDRSIESLLSLTRDWLHEWGYSMELDPYIATDSPVGHVPAQELRVQALSTAQGQPGPWHTLKLIFRGELGIHWTKLDLPCSKGKSYIWASFLHLLQEYLFGRKTDTPRLEDHLDITSSSLPHEPAEDLPACVITLDPEPVSRSIPAQENHLSIETEAVTHVSVHMLGRFVMSIEGTESKLPASRSLSLLKYFLLYHKQTIPREVLMDVFWPDADPETARNNLNVAMHGIRKALHPLIDHPAIFYKDGTYGFAPHIQIWLDLEEFESLVHAGQCLESRNQLAAVSEYETALSLYQGDFLEENPYEGWTVLTRESLRMAYLSTLDSLSRIYFRQERYAACITACQLILTRDRCREDAHCLLMQCYSHQGQDHLALRQYQACREALRLELDVAPAPATTQLFEQIRQHRPV